MASSYETRLGDAPEEGVKAPVVVATNAAITLLGEQTIKSVAVVAGDRVLVRNQADAVENGIYTCSTGEWTRTKDWNNADDVIAGQLVADASDGSIFQTFFDGDYTPDTTEVIFSAWVSVTGELVIVDLINDLRSQVPTISEWVQVRGNSSVGDGDGYFYYWDDSSTATDDGYRVIKVTTITIGRWIRVFDGTVQTVDSSGDDSLYDHPGNYDGQQASVAGYYTPGDGGGGLFVWDADNSDADDGGVTIVPTGQGATGRWRRVVHDGIIHVRAFGCNGSTDSAQYANCVSTCSTNKWAHSIDGLTLSLDTVGNNDAGGNYSFLGFATYGFYLGSGGYYKVIGNGTIKAESANSDEYWGWFEDCDYVEIGDNVTCDGNLTDGSQIVGGTPYVAGVTHFHLGNCRFTRCGTMIVGASITKLTQHFTFDHVRFDDNWGTSCLSCKPNGARWVRGDTVFCTDARGGVNMEQEDVDSFGHTTQPMRVEIQGIMCENLDGDKLAATPVQCYGAVVEDVNGGTVRIGGIQVITCPAAVGNAGGIKIGQGQDNSPADTIKIDHIHVKDTRHAVFMTISTVDGGSVTIDKITGTGLDQIIKVRDSALTATPGKWKSLHIREIYADQVSSVEAANGAGIGISIENTDATYTGYILENLRIDRCEITYAKNSPIATDGAENVILGTFVCDESTSFLSSNIYGFRPVYIECANLTITDKFEAYEYTTDVGSIGELVVSGTADITGMIAKNATNAAYTITGAGTFIFRDCTFTGNGTVGVDEDASFSGTWGIEGGDWSGNTTGPYNLTEAPAWVTGDTAGLLIGTGSFAIGTLAAGAETSTTIAVPGLLPTDVITAQPQGSLGSDGYPCIFNCWFNANEQVVLSATNTSGSNQTPSTQTWVVKAQRYRT